MFLPCRSCELCLVSVFRLVLLFSFGSSLGLFLFGCARRWEKSPGLASRRLAQYRRRKMQCRSESVPALRGRGTCPLAQQRSVQAALSQCRMFFLCFVACGLFCLFFCLF